MEHVTLLAMRPSYLMGLVLGPMACSSPGPGAAEVWVGPHDSVAIAGHVLYVPAGFSVNLFAQMSGVRFLALGPGGAVYATLSGSGKIVRWVDVNRDGVAE